MKSDIPSIGLLSLDSSSVYQTNKLPLQKPVIINFFNSTCDHCQKEAIDLAKNKEAFKKVQLVMISSENLPAIRNFYKEYQLSDIPNIIIGKDYLYTGIKIFKYESTPFCAVYSKGGTYMGSLEGDFNTLKILQKLEKNKG